MRCSLSHQTFNPRSLAELANCKQCLVWEWDEPAFATGPLKQSPVSDTNILSEIIRNLNFVLFDPIFSRLLHGHITWECLETHSGRSERL